MIPSVFVPEMAYTHALFGLTYLSSTSAYADSAAGQSPIGRYKAITALTETVINTIELLQTNHLEFDGVETISSITLLAGNTYALPLFSRIKLTSGSVWLIKDAPELVNVNA